MRIYDILIDNGSVYSKCYDVDQYGRKSDFPEWQPVKASISIESLHLACEAWGFKLSRDKPCDVTFRYYQK